MITRLLDYGPDALLLEVGDVTEVPAVREAALGLPGVLEAVAGAGTVLVEYDLGLTSARAVRAGLASMPLAEVSTAAADEVVVAVRYDGADLDAVAAHTGLSSAEVVARHCAPPYTVRFCGFAPGFAYLDGLDPALWVPRHDAPRPSVPAGSVAIASEFAAIYPRSSPGGWQLLGRTDTVLWDVAAVPPARLGPGTRVRFEPR